MTKLPAPPPEVPLCNDPAGLAPKFRDQLGLVLADLVGLGWNPCLRETTRSAERVAYLFRFGRTYDDGRGVVTNVADPFQGWHFFGLAADCGDRRYEPGAEPEKFWTDLGTCARNRGLTWGGDWPHFQDRPHVQWGPPMRNSPSAEAKALYDQGGVEAVWAAVGAA